MTRIVAVPGAISSRDATLIKAVVEGMMPEIGALVREATAPLLARIDALERRELLLPEKGEPGEAGTDADMAEVGRLIEAAVKSAVAALPVPKDGEPGKDGTGLADVLRDADGGIVVVMTDGRTKSLGRVDGKDGITPTFLDAEFIGRTLRLKFDGDRACEFQLATPEYVGVFKEGETYEPGDMVTWAGSTWHCDEPKGLKPGAPDSGWTLAVKAGRPGKDAK